jgi:cobyrinic acid a,c-diamide synthase
LEQVPTQQEICGTPGVVIAALRGGSGKTIFSVGIIAALRDLGRRVVPFKKGPDYIDAGWLALAAGRPCYNLDTFLIQPKLIQKTYHTHSYGQDFTVIEGNRGLYDCINTQGHTSTAELAKFLDLPIILCIDGTKTTRTMAAVVSGCAQFDPEVKIKGVLLNRIAGARHEKILTDSIQTHCNIPVLGAVPKLRRQSFPERHMGLVPTAEHEWAQESINTIKNIAQKYIDLKAILNLCKPPALGVEVCDFSDTSKRKDSSHHGKPSDVTSLTISSKEHPKIGIIRDSAFQFYYPENLEALENAGAKLIFTSPLSCDTPPEMDALYIGGGFPETHAKELEENYRFRSSIKSLAENGFPIYAECGGLMYLGKELVLDNHTYAMTGVLPLSFGFSTRPQGHGYTIINVVGKNPYYPVGSKIKGHEFHYSSIRDWQGDETSMVFSVERGSGIWQQQDGYCYKNVLATYTHIHASGTTQWAKALVTAAIEYMNKKEKPSISKYTRLLGP